MTGPKLALLVGEGGLPGELVQVLSWSDRDWRILALEPHVPRLDVPVRRFRFETLGTVLADLRAEGVEEVCLAGRIERPQIDPARIDAATLPLVARVQALIQPGDDSVARAARALFEDAGLRIVAAHDVAPHLMPDAGVIGPRALDDAAQADADRAAEVLAALGPLDVGQAAVAAGGHILAVEAIPGTDAMLEALAHYDGWRPRGGLLFKAPKVGQDRTIDVPAIGPDTVTRAADAGLDWIAVAAGGVMVLDRAEVEARLNHTGLGLWIRAADAPVPSP